MKVNCPHCLRSDITESANPGCKYFCLYCANHFSEDFTLYARPAPTTATGGVKHDAEKPMVALIPPHALTEEAKVWTFGMQKYEAFNWSKGFKYTRVLSAMLRHTIAIMMGEDRDAESGCLHAAHVRCCAAMLIEFTVQGRKELDDRIYSGGANDKS